MSKAYETIIILNAHLSQEQLDANIEKFLHVINKHDGEIKLVDRWGKRRLAYEIAKKQYGYYVYIRFNAPEITIQALEREFKLDESVIRHLTVVIPKVVLKDEVIVPIAKDTDDPALESDDPVIVAEPEKKNKMVSETEPRETTPDV